MTRATSTRYQATAAGNWVSRIQAWPEAMIRWWRTGRHYHPERRYMRGPRPTG